MAKSKDGIEVTRGYDAEKIFWRFWKVTYTYPPEYLHDNPRWIRLFRTDYYYRKKRANCFTTFTW